MKHFFGRMFERERPPPPQIHTSFRMTEGGTCPRITGSARDAPAARGVVLSRLQSIQFVALIQSMDCCTSALVVSELAEASNLVGFACMNGIQPGSV